MNMINFNYVMTLESDAFQKIYNRITRPLTIFIYAFLKTPLEEKFMTEKIPDKIKREFLDEAEYTKEITPAQRSSSQMTILKTVRELQDSMEIPVFKWKLPDNKILKGENYKVPIKGKFELKYEDGTLALDGFVEDKQRTGFWRHFYPNGKVMAEGTYERGEKEGHWIFNYLNGNKKTEGEFTENLKNGQWVEYDKDGNETIVNFQRGKIIS